jgi:uncharacterized SAM-binding protein YcdF (DUF218 family)
VSDDAPPTDAAVPSGPAGPPAAGDPVAEDPPVPDPPAVDVTVPVMLTVPDVTLPNPPVPDVMATDLPAPEVTVPDLPVPDLWAPDPSIAARPPEPDPLWAATAPTPVAPGEPTPPYGVGLAPQPGRGRPAKARRTRRRSRSRSPWWRRLRRLVALAVLVALGYLLVTYAQVWATGRRDQARPVDAIVVMGAAQYDGTPSPQLAARLDHAADLWERGLAPIVVVTGGRLPGDRFTEAEASAAYLVERGVPAGAIVQEQEGHSSWESLENVADLLTGAGVERVLLVSDPFHSLRIRLTAEELGFEAYTSPTRSSPVSGTSARSREAKEALGVAAGRIIGFERLWRLTG